MIQKSMLRLLRHNLTRSYLFSEQKTTSQKQAQVQEPLQQRKDQTSQQDYHLEKQNRNTVGWWIYRFFFWGSFSLLSYNVYQVYNNKGRVPLKDLPGTTPYFVDAADYIVKEYNSAIEFISQPPSKKLLQDVVHPDFHPQTIVFSLNGTLIKSEYVFGKGQRYTLRPGVENLLKSLARKYEVVIFGDEDLHIIMNTIERIDPRHMYIQGALGRESMVWRNGEFIKDLRYLNRDLKKIIVVDTVKENLKLQPENLVLIPKFNGQTDDITLKKLALLIDRLQTEPDVRKCLKTLGENPLDSYYEKVISRQKRLEQKNNSAIFSLFKGKAKKEEQTD